MNTIPLSIADMRIDLLSPLTLAEMGIEGRYGPFRTSSAGAPDIVITWQEGDPTPEASASMIYEFGDGPSISVYRSVDRGTFLVSISYPSRSAPDRHTAVVEADASWGRITVTERQAGDSWMSLLGIGAGELIVRTRILLHSGVVFHACGVDDNGKGIVLVGHAGAGKSTQASMWSQFSGVTVMNDDRVAVRPYNGAYRCYGTPWGGTADIATNHSAPLTAIFCLEQADRNEVVKLSTEEAVRLLLPRAFLPYWDENLLTRALDNVSAITGDVPCYLLKCRPEPSVIPLVRSVL
jgi:hypothetical protein